MRVGIIGGPIMYREAVTARIESHGSTVVSPDDMADVDVVLVYCETERDWDTLESVGSCPVVVVLPKFDRSGFVRALAAGAGVAHVATSSELVYAAAEAAAHGEALLPIKLAQFLALGSLPDSETEPFTSDERTLLVALSQGQTIRQIGADLHYSDRTVRRRMQGLYLKLEVDSRSNAIKKIRHEQLAERFGGIEAPN